MEKKPFDIAVVGAGAAGLMAAIAAARTACPEAKPPTVLLFDSRPKIGAKILMSGGTRCNVTNREVTPLDFQGGPRHFVKHVFEAFTPQATLEFFESIGVELVLEPTGKYFPVTHSAHTVLNALVKETERLGVILKTGVRITDVRGDCTRFRGTVTPNSSEDSRKSDSPEKAGTVTFPFQLKSSGGWEAETRKVILTTGGLSYPSTGSDGTGYAIAKSFGHTVVGTFPALTPLLTGDEDWRALSGLSLEAKLSFLKNGKKQAECRGSFLFTHFGFSGPAALDISRHWSAAKPGDRAQILASFLPAEQEAFVEAAFQTAQSKNPKKQIRNFLAEQFSLPDRFVETFLKKAEVRENEILGPCSAQNRKRLIRLLLNCPLEITGVFGYKKAEVTAGGVDLKEVKVATMESKIVSGLYLAGEILDVDGRIGGFNFQWAWSTGAVAGKSAAQSLAP